MSYNKIPQGSGRFLLNTTGGTITSGHTASLGATGDGFSNIVIPTWADVVEFHFSLWINPSIAWAARLLPDGVSTGVTSARLQGQSVIDASELSHFTLGISVDASRESINGWGRFDVTAGEKFFEVNSHTRLSTGAIQHCQGWRGCIDTAGRVADLDIAGATSAGSLSNAFLANTWIDVFAVKN